MGNILLIDDEQELATLYDTYLQMSGFKTMSFTDPSLAFEYYKQNVEKYCLVLTDLRMPGISGIDLANKIRKLNSKVKILLITAFPVNNVDNDMKIKEAHIDKIIQKPIKLSKLKEIVNHCMIK